MAGGEGRSGERAALMRVLVTGAAGFAGRALVRELAAGRHSVRAAVHREGAAVAGAESRWAGDLVTADLGAAVEGVDAVAHLAAVVHRADGAGSGDFCRVNVEATIRLAETAARAGARRFLFVSSVKAVGETTAAEPFSEDSEPAPRDAYGVSKWQAERALRGAAFGGMDVVVVRPPLVYGAGVKANFLALLHLCDTPLPIPLGAARDNARSMIYLGNLTDAIRRALETPAAAGRTYFVRDGEDLAPAELVARLRRAMGRRSNLIAVPHAPLAVLATLAGRSAALDRVFGALRIDDSRIRAELGWWPPFTVTQGLVATASWYRALRSKRDYATKPLC